MTLIGLIKTKVVGTASAGALVAIRATGVLAMTLNASPKVCGKA